MHDQPSQRWFLGLTTVHAGPYVDVVCYTFQSPVLIVTVLSSSVYSDIFQQFESPLQIYSHLNV